MTLSIPTLLRISVAGILAGLCSIQAAFAQARIEQAWVRATVPHQKASGAFMRITADKDTALVAASSPAARTMEVHEMKHEQGVMKMRAIDRLPLPAGKAVELAPGGYHLMLFDLSTRLEAGAIVPITLVFEDKDGKRESLTVDATVQPLTGHAPAGHHKH